jgi:hypothetical protein
MVRNDPKRPAAKALPSLQEDHRSLVFKLDSYCHHDQHGEQQKQCDRRKHQVEQPLAEPLCAAQRRALQLGHPDRAKLEVSRTKHGGSVAVW